MKSVLSGQHNIRHLFSTSLAFMNFVLTRTSSETVYHYNISIKEHFVSIHNIET